MIAPRWFAVLLVAGTFHSGIVSAEAKNSRHVYTNDDEVFQHSDSKPAAASTEEPPADAATPETDGEKIAPFAATPMQVVDKMLDMAGVSSKDTVYDLGSGDGRIVIRAAQRNAKAVGVELDAALAKSRKAKYERRSSIISQKSFRGIC